MSLHVISYSFFFSSFHLLFQSRLSSQENQIIECEAALNARTEECMTVRAERDEAAGKLEISEASLVTSLAQIEDLQAQLSTKQVQPVLFNNNTLIGAV